MSKLTFSTPSESPRPKHLGISPPRLNSKLTLTTNHPLMTLGSPEGNFPDLIPKKANKVGDEKDLSLSSVEDERIQNQTNGYEFYSLQMNTSKNNLYYSENFVPTDNKLLSESLNVIQPDVARIEDLNKIERQKVSQRSETPHKMLTPQSHQKVPDAENDSAIIKYIKDRNKIISSQSTPKSHSGPLDLSQPEEFSAVADWCESPSMLRSIPNFELPIEMSSTIGIQNDLDSPDVISSSTQEDKSAYQALLDPYTGCVALRQRTDTKANSRPMRRKIFVPPDDDRISSDSVSACSLESEDEPPEPEPIAVDQVQPDSEVDDGKRSKSTNTVSECSDPIPEYSAAEELQDERSWLTVQHGGRNSTCDMKVIEPYKRVLSHGGYEESGAAIIVFSACHLPDTARTDYRYVMDNLFLYVIWSLERLVTDEYVLVYLHGSAGRRRLPTFAWLHECYKLIDRRLRKSLKHLYLVHPTFWLKSFVVITKPFVSSKFFRKLSYVRNLSELMERVPVEPNAIPDLVKQYDATRR